MCLSTDIRGGSDQDRLLTVIQLPFADQLLKEIEIIRRTGVAISAPSLAASAAPARLGPTQASTRSAPPSVT